MAQGDLVTASRFNNLQNRISSILGFGAGNTGYGQGLSGYGSSASSLEVSNDDQQVNINKILTENANSLFIDLVRARIHQIGPSDQEVATIVSSLLTDEQQILFIKDENVVAEETSFFVKNSAPENPEQDPLGNLKGFADLERIMDNVEQDKFLMHPTQGEYEQGLQDTFTNNWNNQRTHEVKVTFRSADHRRHFFNSGGEIRLEFDLTPSNNDPKSAEWENLLDTAGIVIFNYNSTSRKAATDPSVYVGAVSPTETAIGNGQLVTSYQQIYKKTSNSFSSSGIYSANLVKVEAKEVSGDAIQFLVTFEDLSQDPNIDGFVQGTLTSTIGHFRAVGSFTDAADAYLNIEVPPPVYEEISGL